MQQEHFQWLCCSYLYVLSQFQVSGMNAQTFQFEQLTVLNFDGSPTVCSINRRWENNIFSKQSDNRKSWVPSTAQIGKVFLENQCKKTLHIWCDISIICRCFSITKERNFFALLLQRYLFLTLEIETGFINMNNITSDTISIALSGLFH